MTDKAKDLHERYPRSGRPWASYLRARRDEPGLTYRQYLAEYLHCSPDQVDVRRAEKKVFRK